jgi:hypothetical protein
MYGTYAGYATYGERTGAGQPSLIMKTVGQDPRSAYEAYVAYEAYQALI